MELIMIMPLKFIGIYCSNSLIVNLVRICYKLNVNRGEVMNLYYLLFEGFTELSIFI